MVVLLLDCPGFAIKYIAGLDTLLLVDVEILQRFAGSGKCFGANPAL
jgi:hypothetical protein